MGDHLDHQPGHRAGPPRAAGVANRPGPAGAPDRRGRPADAYLTDQVSLYTALVDTNQAVTIGIDQLIHQPSTEPFAVIPSSYELMLAEQVLYMAHNREHKLAGLLGQLDDRYDWVPID